MDSVSGKVAAIVEDVLCEKLVDAPITSDHPALKLLKALRGFRNRAIVNILKRMGIDQALSLDALCFESENPELPRAIVDLRRKMIRIFLLLRNEEVRDVLQFCVRWEQGIHEQLRSVSRQS